MSELDLIFLGPPGAGKGTQAQRLSDDFGLPYIATGDILRDAVRDGSDLGRIAKRCMDCGDLVPDDVVMDIVAERLDRPDSADGFILDGFPRTVAQAEALERELDELGRDITAVIFIEVGEDEVVRRLSGRRVCVKQGHNFHVDFDPPKHPERCDIDGSRLMVRDDDQADTVRQRLVTYRGKTAPLVDLYEEKGLVRRIDGEQAPDAVHDHIRAILATLRMEEQV